MSHLCPPDGICPISPCVQSKQWNQHGPDSRDAKRGKVLHSRATRLLPRLGKLVRTVSEASRGLRLHCPLGLKDWKTNCWHSGGWERRKGYTGWWPWRGWSAGSGRWESWGWWCRPGPTRGRHLGASGWEHGACSRGWLPLLPCCLCSGHHQVGPVNSLWTEKREWSNWSQTLLSWWQPFRSSVIHPHCYICNLTAAKVSPSFQVCLRLPAAGRCITFALYSKHVWNPAINGELV